MTDYTARYGLEFNPFIKNATQGLSQCFRQLPVEACRYGAACREADCPDALIEPQVVRLAALLAQSVRAVGDGHGGNPQTFHALRAPKVCPGAESRFFLQCHL